MTVQQLIKTLEKYPKNMEVAIQVSERMYWDAEAVKIMELEYEDLQQYDEYGDYIEGSDLRDTVVISYE